MSYFNFKLLPKPNRSRKGILWFALVVFALAGGLDLSARAFPLDANTIVSAEDLPPCTGDLVLVQLVYTGPAGVDIFVYRQANATQPIGQFTGVQTGDILTVDTRTGSFGNLLSTTWFDIQDPNQPCRGTGGTQTLGNAGAGNACMVAVPSGCGSYATGIVFGDLRVVSFQDQTGQSVNLPIFINGTSGQSAQIPTSGSPRRNNGTGQAKSGADLDGEGLSYNLATQELDVNPGDGIEINSDLVEFKATDVAGPGIIANSNNLQVNPGDGVTILSNQVRVNANDLVNTSSGLSTTGNDLQVNTDGTTLEIDPNNDLRIASGAAGAGLTGGSNQPLAVGDGAGIGVTANAIQVNVDNSTVQIDGFTDQLEVKPGGITNTELATDAVGTGNIIDGSVNPRDLASGGNSKILTTDAAGNVVWADQTTFTPTQTDGDGLVIDVANSETDVNTGDGLTINNDQVEVVASDIEGNGLSVVNNDLNVNTGDGLTITSDNIEVVASDIDGNGLSTVNNNLNVNGGHGIMVAGDQVRVDVRDLDGAGLGANLSTFEMDVNTDNSTLEINGSDQIAVKQDGITTNEILDGTISTSDLGQNGASSGQVLVWNGSTWVPATNADADSDPLNEIQTLSQSGTSVTLSNGGGSISVADNDNDASNEIQNLSSTVSGTTRNINISGGTGTSINVADNDNDASNEIQNLSSTVSGTTRNINISGGTGTSISVADNDNNSSNELQTLSQSGTSVTLSNGGGSISVADNDNDASNEIQTITKSGSTVTLSNGGGSFTDAVNDADASPTNEIQNLSLSGNTLSISGSNNVSLAGFANTDNQNLSSTVSGTNRTINISGGTGTIISVADNDNNSSNELQTISKSGSTVTLSNGGGSFTDEVNDADSSPTNEIQSLSISGSTISLSGGGTVTVPSSADNLGNHTATTNIQMGDRNILDANTVQANILLDPEDATLTVQDNLQVIGNTSTSGEFEGRISVEDTRNTNAGPDTYDNEVHFEFKNRTTIGSPGTGTYGGLITLAPWGDNSGNQHHQMFFNDGGIYYRNGFPNNTTWNGWDQVMTQSTLPDNSASNELQTLGISGSTVTLSNGGGSVSIPSSADNLGNHTATTNLNMTNREIDNIAKLDMTPGNGNGIRFWSSDSYKISMGNSADYRYGPVTDYSIKSNMDGSAGRGWSWGINGATPVAAIGSNGAMQIQGSLKVSNDNTTGGGLILADDGGIFDRNDGYASLAFSSGIDIEDAQDNGDHLSVTFNDSYPEISGYRNNGSTLVEFRTGMYNNGGTFYSQNQMFARAGIANDAGTLTFNDDVLVTSLAGSGNRMVVADPSGNLVASAIPGGPDNLGNHTATTTLNMNNQNIINVNQVSTRATSDYDKLRVYPSSTYTIGMHSGMTYGFLNDWATTFTMNNESDRGWIWRDDADATSDGAMSLTTAGQMYVKGNSTFASRLAIGTTNFTYPLWVNSGATGNWGARVSNGNANVYMGHSSGYGIHINTGATNSSSRYALEVRNANQTHMYVRDDGLTGFRTSAPAATVHIKAHSTNASTGGLRLEYATNGNNWQMGVSSDAWLRFTRNGVNNAGVAFTGGGVTIHSDKRIKKDIKSMDNVLDQVMQLRPVTYVPKEVENARPTIGVIAQEVKEVFPETVFYDKEIDRYSVKYDDFGVVAIKAIQEMNAQNMKREAEVDEELANLRKQVEKVTPEQSQRGDPAPTPSNDPGATATLTSAQELILRQQELILRMEQRMGDLEGRLVKQENQYQDLIDRLYLSEQAIIELGSCCDDKNGGNQLETGGAETMLFQNHPNPFNRTTTITYKLSETGPTELIIYDESSMPVQTIVDKSQDAGTYSVEWDGTHFTSGVYIYMLKQNGTVLAKKMVLIK